MAQPATETRAGERPWWLNLIWQGKIGPAFWTVAGVISLTVNIVLLAVLIVLAQHLFTLKHIVQDQLLGGLSANFAAMDAAVIRTTVEVHDQIPVVFDLPVETETVVTLTQDVVIRGARVNLVTGGLQIIGAPANIVLPKGTQLPIKLNITVPVSTQVPVDLTVPVNIPLKETELHQPFVGLQQVVAPYQQLLAQTPDSWGPVLCPLLEPFCSWLHLSTEPRPASP
ncbi:MAG TPA: hypothetical protein G4O04_06780 [Anaerolineae bacterium]|nr:hypothetical protein [Anaerolineae bacterium]HID84456.1 hypothetical protein [Anaerolineales bacterium]